MPRRNDKALALGRSRQQRKKAKMLADRRRALEMGGVEVDGSRRKQKGGEVDG
jgi:hypothetical protein